jgi:hypothetical protein
LARTPLQILAVLCLCGFVYTQTVPGVDSELDRQRRIDSMKRELRTLKKPERKDDFERLQVQLAQLGEPEQLQQILCEMDFGSPAVVQVNAIIKLRSVGGWFSINSAAKFLGDDPRYKRPNSGVYGMEPSLQVAALVTLPHVAPNPPLGEVQIKTPPTDYSNEIRVWVEWLGKNHDSLTKLQPAGEGLVSSESVCRGVLRDDLVSIYYSWHVKQKASVRRE